MFEEEGRLYCKSSRTYSDNGTEGARGNRADGPRRAPNHSSLKPRGPFPSLQPNRTRSTSPNRSEALEHTGASEAAMANKCGGCRRKVGLMGFRCRCGREFCAEHRHSDRHACGFDYKAAGKEALARANPVMRAPTIVRI